MTKMLTIRVYGMPPTIGPAQLNVLVEKLKGAGHDTFNIAPAETLVYFPADINQLAGDILVCMVDGCSEAQIGANDVLRGRLADCLVQFARAANLVECKMVRVIISRQPIGLCEVSTGATSEQ